MYFFFGYLKCSYHSIHTPNKKSTLHFFPYYPNSTNITYLPAPNTESIKYSTFSVCTMYIISTSSYYYYKYITSCSYIPNKKKKKFYPCIPFSLSSSYIHNIFFLFIYLFILSFRVYSLIIEA